VVYAIFGFMWVTRGCYPVFDKILTWQIIQLALAWLVGCMVITYLGVWNVGNAAHVSGLLFGVAVAGAFVLPRRRVLMRAALAALIVLAIVPLFWCPWSITWLSVRAYDAHQARQFDLALERYTQIIRLDPRNAWAYHNRSTVYAELGQTDKAHADWQQALRLDPALGK
jgi:GlpG protein